MSLATDVSQEALSFCLPDGRIEAQLVTVRAGQRRGIDVGRLNRVKLGVQGFPMSQNLDALGLLAAELPQELDTLVVTEGSKARRQLGLVEFGHLGRHGDADIGVTARVVVPMVADFFGGSVIVELESHLVGPIGLVGVDDGDIAGELRVLPGIGHGELTQHDR